MLPSVWALCLLLAAPPGLALADAVAALEADDADAARAALGAPPATEAELAHLQPPSPANAAQSAEARLIAAEALGRTGRHGEALQQLAAAEHLLPQVADLILALRARLQRQLHAWPQAYAAWAQLRGRHPRSPWAREACFGMADALYAQGQWRAAYDAYDTALRRCGHDSAGAREPSRDSTARYNLGCLAQRLGHTSRAVRHYNDTIRRDLGSPIAARAQERLAALTAPAPNLGQVFEGVDRALEARQMAQASRALSAAAKLVQTEAHRDALQARQASALMRQQDYAGAIALLTPLVRRSRGTARVAQARNLAMALAQSHQNDAAILILEELASWEPHSRSSREARYQAAWLTYNNGDFAAARPKFIAFVRAFPRDHNAAEARWLAAWTAYRGGDLQGARLDLMQLHRAARHGPAAARARYWLARVEAQLGNQAEALQLYASLQKSSRQYYGLMAALRLQDLQPQASKPPPLQATAALPADEADVAARAEASPWGQALAWEGPAGQRVQSLLRLGYRDEATAALAALPGERGSGTSVALSRAQLLHTFGDDAAAYRLASNALGSDAGAKRGALTPQIWRLAYPQAHAERVHHTARAYGVAPELIFAVMRQESGFEPRALSWAHARGLLQVIPKTARRIAQALAEPLNDVQDMLEPERNIRFGGWYLAQLTTMFDGNVLAAIAGYNAGPQAVQRWLSRRRGAPVDEFVEDISFRETRQYVKNVAANLQVYAQLWRRRPFAWPRTMGDGWHDTVDF